MVKDKWKRARITKTSNTFCFWLLALPAGKPALIGLPQWVNAGMRPVVNRSSKGRHTIQQIVNLKVKRKRNVLSPAGLNCLPWSVRAAETCELEYENARFHCMRWPCTECSRAVKI